MSAPTWRPEQGKGYRVSDVRSEAPVGQSFSTRGTAIVLETNAHETTWRWKGQRTTFLSSTTEFVRMVETGRLPSA